MELNITNGFCFNEYIKNIQEGVFVSFNEALIEGDLLFPIFDEEFVINRIKVHKVTKDEYIKKMDFFINQNVNNYDVINLWFGLDAFCQINMFALLTYLEDIKYNGKIFYQAIDDVTFALLGEKIEISLNGFINEYKKLIDGNYISTKYDFINNGIKDYLYIKNKDNHFYQYIKENANKLSKNQMIMNILMMSSKYGLSDLYIEKMIDEVM